jgi:hypothetical protein
MLNRWRPRLIGFAIGAPLGILIGILSAWLSRCQEKCTGPLAWTSQRAGRTKTTHSASQAARAVQTNYSTPASGLRPANTSLPRTYALTCAADL